MVLKQYSTLTSGTINASNTKQDLWVIHNAISLAITLTMVLPSNPADGQKVGLCSTLGVTTLTLSSSISIIGTLATLAAGGFAEWIFDITGNQWFRCG